MSTYLDSDVRARIESFVDDLTDLIRLSALESVQEALGSTAAGRAPARKKKGRKKRKKASRKRGRRSSADVDAIGSTVLSHVRSNPGQRLEEISAELGTPSSTLKRPVALLLEEGALRREGQARGTKYFVGSGNPRRKTSKGRRKKKKISRKGARRKKKRARKTKGAAA